MVETTASLRCGDVSGEKSFRKGNGNENTFNNKVNDVSEDYNEENAAKRTRKEATAEFDVNKKKKQLDLIRSSHNDVETTTITSKSATIQPSSRSQDIIPGKFLKDVLALSAAYIQAHIREASFKQTTFTKGQINRLVKHGFVHGGHLREYGYTSTRIVCAFCGFSCHKNDVKSATALHAKSAQNCSYLQCVESLKFSVTGNTELVIDCNCKFANAVTDVGTFIKSHIDTVALVMKCGYNRNAVVAVLLKYALLKKSSDTGVLTASELLSYAQCETNVQTAMCIAQSDYPDLWSLCNLEEICPDVPLPDHDAYAPCPISCSEIFYTDLSTYLPFVEKYRTTHKAESETLSNKCKLCQIQRANVVFVPCAHFCVCLQCARDMPETSVCPICRIGIHDVMQVYYC